MLFSIPNISIGEIRDLNRHRTGNKYIDLYPQGFYNCVDCLEDCEKQFKKTMDFKFLKDLGLEGTEIIKNAKELDPEEGVYSLPLGTQLIFKHRTTLDKFIYEVELRTGIGAHYKYSEHMKDLLQILYEIHPVFRGLILEGNAEPE